MVSLSPPLLSVYYCYDPTDLAFSRVLDVHLGPLKRNGWIHAWDDQQIPAGTEWEREREAHLHTAHLLILLVSADFLASESGVHMIQVALQRHQTGEAIAIPILVRAANWEETDLRILQVLPREQKAITSWPDQDVIWREVTREIQRVVEALRKWVFVAYSPEDRAFVEQLRQDMVPSGVLLWSLEKGQNTHDLTRDETRNAMRAVSAVILIASPEASNSRLVKAQLALAADYQRPILVVWARGEDWRASNPGKWRVQEVIDARGSRYEAARNIVLMRLRQGVTALPPFVRPQPSMESRNPYKGLHAFTRDDAGDFFGREALIEELATTVETMLTLEKKGSPQIRLLPVIGPSGSGKSSVVMAGLLPCLQSGGVFDSEEWIYLDPLFPGTHPLEALAASLAQQFPARSVLSLREDFTSDSVRALHLLACQLVQASQRKVVLVVDQFEEVFTLTTSEEERQHFLDLLITAVTELQGPVLVVLTLRADFYDRPMQYPELYQLIDAHHVSVLPMESEDLRRVIERPAQLPDVQLTFEGDLIGDLLFEMRAQVGALPLLQFTLDQLFEHRDGHLLTLHAYHEIGRVKGALSRHAEKTYQDLSSSEHQAMARALFVRLIEPGMTDQDTTRRRAALSEFDLADASGKQRIQETLEIFIKARLLTTNQSRGITIVEVSHEALIREWKRLVEWLREAREDIHLQQTISEDVAEWEQRGKPRDRLYRGSQLKEASTWARRNVPSRQEVAFLQASTRRRVQSALGVVVVVLLLLSTIGVAGLVLSRQPADPTHVTNLQNDGPGSLRQAITTAPDGETITFDPSLRGTIRLTSGNLNISKNLTLRGPGAGNVAISNDSRGFIVYIIASVSVSISGLAFKDSTLKLRSTDPDLNSFIHNRGTLSLTNSVISGNRVSVDNGNLLCAGGIYNAGALTLSNTVVSNNSVSGGSTESFCVGGILSLDRLIITNSTVSDNRASGDNSKFICSGGIYDEGTFALSNSTVSGNRATGGMCSGGIYNFQGTLILTNSTVSDNMTGYNGGGIFSSGGQVDITFCTIYGNTAREGGGGYIAVAKTSSKGVTIRNSIIAGNSASVHPNISGPLISDGYNLIQDFSSATSASDPLNKHLTDISGDRFANLRIDPRLQDNGGLAQPHTWTHRLLQNSPAIDRIPPATCQVNNISTDQRGIQRPQGKGCDIGAYEYGPIT
jgi:AAA ATPase domain/TIR domain